MNICQEIPNLFTIERKPKLFLFLFPALNHHKTLFRVKRYEAIRIAEVFQILRESATLLRYAYSALPVLFKSLLVRLPAEEKRWLEIHRTSGFSAFVPGLKKPAVVN
jgi:hypothetical protein